MQIPSEYKGSDECVSPYRYVREGLRNGLTILAGEARPFSRLLGNSSALFTICTWQKERSF
jgi:hypothetical protein